MRIFNSLSRAPEAFVSPSDGKVIMYVCGLTPYDSAHIGHARAYVSFDMIKRYLIKQGFKVLHIQNITDVDDKIIKRCRETGADPKKLTEQNHSEALELFGQLNILPADVYPKVTGHIPEIIELVSLLMKKGAAYETDAGVYFDISSFPAYGALSGQNLEQIRGGSRFEVDETKQDSADFALWKKTKGDLLEFDSPWGIGRPGWHIECSAMARKYAGRTLDIHGGARDLIFPHHENEIAQSEAADGRQFCRYWMHVGFLTVGGEKMSKSLGNFITLRQALTTSSPAALRLFYLQAHYRSPLDYDEEALQSMEESAERIFNSLGLIREACEAKSPAHTDKGFREKSDELIKQFHSHMEDDFNTPEALASLHGLLHVANTHISGRHDREQLVKVKAAIEDMLWMLGLEENKKPAIEEKSAALSALVEELGGTKPKTANEALETLITMRDAARHKKDYKASDLIRSRLKEIGVILEDKPGGVRWKLA